MSNYELERQTIYKADWEGVPVYRIDPKSTSTLCPRCGGLLQEDKQRRRDVWCGICKRWLDRDVVAAMNISYKGLHRFCNPQGDTAETVKGNPDLEMIQDPAILRVDVSKLEARGFI